jgi:fluoride ion exporter CrcB/FEX
VEAEAIDTTTEKPNGPVAAGLLAAGIGAFVLGILTTVGEASESFSASLQYNDRVGPLSGKTLVSTAAFIGAWVVLGAVLRHRNLAWRPVLAMTAVLVGLGVLGTFPTFFQAFAPE